MRRIVEAGEKKARQVLTEHLEDLHKVAKALLEYETLNGEEVLALMRNEPIRQGGGDPGPTKPLSTIPSSGGTVVQRPTGFEPKPQPGA